MECLSIGRFLLDSKQNKQQIPAREGGEIIGSSLREGKSQDQWRIISSDLPEEGEDGH
jgi:hypothetical protein